MFPPPTQRYHPLSPKNNLKETEKKKERKRITH